jgi:hypothetical protein
LADGEASTGATRLWERLPKPLRRRGPRSRYEKCLILDLIDDATREGVPLDEAARTCGVDLGALARWREERRRILQTVDELERAAGPLISL